MQTPPPAPTPQPKKPSPWRSVALAAAAVGLGSTLLAMSQTHQQPAPSPSAQARQLPPDLMTEPLSLSMLPPDEATQAVANSRLSNQEKTNLLAALKDNRIRMAALPVADASGQTGHIISISSAGLTQQVTLTPQAQPVYLPITQEGIITITRTSPPQLGPTSIATLNVFHAVVVLPPLTPTAPSLSVPVIVQ